MTRTRRAPERAELATWMQDAFICAPGAQLRAEDQKKLGELEGLLTELSRISSASHLIDVGAGKAYLGVMAKRAFGIAKVTLIERNPRLLADAKSAALKLGVDRDLEVRPLDASSPLAFAQLDSDLPRVVVALHACGPLTDHALEGAIEIGARWVLLAPCCHSRQCAFWSRASQIADNAGIVEQAELRGRFIESVIDSHRVLRLTAAGYEVTTVAFTKASITPRNMLIRARWSGEAKKMDEARLQLLQMEAAGG